MISQSVRLVEVTSNIWGTKFKIHGLATALPENLGSVTYKTSLLHLQPRQMTLLITELRDDIFLSPDSIYSQAEDEEEDFSIIVGASSDPSSSTPTHQLHAHHQHQQGPNGTASVNGGAPEIYHSHQVIYHPQGAGSPPVVPTNRCVLQPRQSSGGISGSSGCGSFNGISNPMRSGLSNTTASSARSANLPPPNHPRRVPAPASSMVVNPFEVYSDDEDEFPYVDLTTNPDMVNLRYDKEQVAGLLFVL
jgi:hypothetical protein